MSWFRTFTLLCRNEEVGAFRKSAGSKALDGLLTRPSTNTFLVVRKVTKAVVVLQD